MKKPSFSGNFKKDLFGQFARVAKALANGHRLELIEFLAQGERSVDELARLTGLSVARRVSVTRLVSCDASGALRAALVAVRGLVTARARQLFPSLS